MEVSYMTAGIKNDLEINMIYSTETGLLEKFYLLQENSTHTLEYEIVKDAGGLFGTPGFELSVLLLGFIAVPILYKKKK